MSDRYVLDNKIVYDTVMLTAMGVSLCNVLFGMKQKHTISFLSNSGHRNNWPYSLFSAQVKLYLHRIKKIKVGLRLR